MAVLKIYLLYSLLICFEIFLCPLTISRNLRAPENSVFSPLFTDTR